MSKVFEEECLDGSVETECHVPNYMFDEQHTDNDPNDKAKMSAMHEAKWENSATTDRDVTNVLFDVDFDVVYNRWQNEKIFTDLGQVSATSEKDVIRKYSM